MKNILLFTIVALTLLTIPVHGSIHATSDINSTGITGAVISGTTISGETLSGSIKKTTKPHRKVKKAIIKAKTMTIQTGGVATGDTIVVDYIGKYTDGSVFDTSIESVARSANIYQAGRDYTGGLTFIVGAGEMIAGFDGGVIGMKVGKTKTITIPAKSAYGPKEITVNISDLPPKKSGNGIYKAGDSLSETINIISIDYATGTCIITNPHPLGGKDLIFIITLRSRK